MNWKPFGLPAACMLFVLGVGGVSAQTTPPQGSSSQTAQPSQATPAGDEQQIRAADDQLLQASRSNDKETLRQLMANDMTWVNPTGKTTDRDEMLSGTLRPPETVNIERVRPSGDSAIVVGAAQWTDGRKQRFVQEWVKRDGRWRLFAHQATPMATSAEPSPASAPPSPAGTTGRSAMRPSPPVLKSDEERAVWKAENDLQQAFLKGDAAAYSALTTDDYVRVMANGDQQDKSQFLQDVKRNATQAGGRLETGDAQVAVTGDSARLVLTMWGTLPSGQAVPPTRMTRVFVRRDGGWQQAATIFTRIDQR